MKTKTAAKDILFEEVLASEIKDRAFRAEFDGADIEAMVAVQLAKAREEAGMTQGQLAVRAHMKRQAINRIETKGQNLTLQTLGKISHALGFYVEIRLKRPQPPEFDQLSNAPAGDS
ncbi:MAG: helix-turn-helix transcriptional regulator [Elusimicrobiota bacterium]